MESAAICVCVGSEHIYFFKAQILCVPDSMQYIEGTCIFNLFRRRPSVSDRTIRTSKHKVMADRISSGVSNLGRASLRLK